MSSFWYEQQIGALPLIQGICIPFTTTLEDAKQQLASRPHDSAYAVTNEHHECIGVITQLALRQGLENLGPDAWVSELNVTRDTVLQADELIVNALARFKENLPSLFAVVETKMVRGLISSSMILQHIVQNHLAVPSPAAQEITSLSRQFVSQVAHDIRNPLSIISAVSSLLELGSTTTDQMAQYMRLIQRASRQTLQISDGLIQLERYTCKSNIDRKAVQLADFLREVEEENLEWVAYRGQKLIVNACADKMLMADTYLLKRALLNLIDNACKFSKPKGRIYLDAERRLVDGCEMVNFVVRDEGIGINEQQKDMLFEPFQKLTTDKEALGYGLGLTIAKRFVQFHDGTIKMQRIPSGGTAFILAIPCLAPTDSIEIHREKTSSVSTASP